MIITNAPYRYELVWRSFLKKNVDNINMKANSEKLL